MGCKVAVHVIHPQEEEEEEIKKSNSIKKSKILPRDESEEFYVPDGEYINPLGT